MPQLDELLDNVVSAIARRDLAASLACFTAGAVVLGSEQGEETRGLDELRSFFLRAFAKPGAYHFLFEHRSWTMRGDIAWVISNGSVIEPEQDVAKPYRLVAIFERESEDWRMALWSGTEPV